MTTSQEIALRSGCPPETIAANLSNSALFSDIADCERIGHLSGWRERFYQALLVERYVRPPVFREDEPEDPRDLDELDFAGTPSLAPA
jgi:hypothetical protein